jgi:uncharacterized protein (TIGR02246 family)
MLVGDRSILNPREEMMKTEQKDTADPQTAQEIRAWTMKHAEIYNKNDATAYAAFFTEDAVYVTPEGVLYGRQAIEKKYANDFQQWHPTNYVVNVHQVNAIGNDVWKFGEWSCAVQTQDGLFPVNGYFAAILVRVDGTWKERLTCYNMAAPTQTK